MEVISFCCFGVKVSSETNRLLKLEFEITSVTTFHTLRYLIDQPNQFTVHRQRGHAVHPDVTDGPADRLAHVDKAVLDVSLSEQLAVKVERVLPPRDPVLGDVVERGGRSPRGNVGPEPPEHPDSVTGLQDTGGVLEQHGDAAVAVAGEDAPGVHVEHKLVAPLRLESITMIFDYLLESLYVVMFGLFSADVTPPPHHCIGGDFAKRSYKLIFGDGWVNFIKKI